MSKTRKLEAVFLGYECLKCLNVNFPMCVESIPLLILNFVNLT